jgi:hypothetical protein
MKATVYISSLIILWMAIALTNIHAAVAIPSTTIPDSIRQIQYSFTLRNTTNHTLHSSDFWTYAPLNINSIQQCKDLQASHPYKLISDSLGNQILHFTFPDIPPYATMIITVRVRLSFSEKVNSLPTGGLNPYLIPEKYIEIDDPDIRVAAASLKRTGPLDTARQIYQWVSGHIKEYVYSAVDYGAAYALRNRKGDCSEAMYLFVALCRANGIPARGLGGYVYGSNAVLDPNAYHNWGEFYADGAWQVADPQRKVFQLGQSRYIVMRIIGKTQDNPMGNNNHFHFKGEGLEVRMNY